MVEHGEYIYFKICVDQATQVLFSIQNLKGRADMYIGITSSKDDRYVLYLRIHFSHECESYLLKTDLLQECGVLIRSYALDCNGLTQQKFDKNAFVGNHKVPFPKAEAFTWSKVGHPKLTGASNTETRAHTHTFPHAR